MGELLLKNEAEELARVQEWAGEVHAGAEFRVWSLGFRIVGLGLRIEGLGFRL